MPHDPGHKQLGHRLDDPRAADAGRADLLGRQLVRPGFFADHLKARLAGGAVDPHALDRAGRGALAVRDLRALEGRAGRAAAALEPRAVAQHDLGVGAHVDQQHQLVALLGRLGQQHADVVGADMAGLQRHAVDVRAGVQLQPQLARLDVERRVRGQREGRRAQVGRVEPQQDVVHHGVAGDHDLVDVAGAQPAACAASPASLLSPWMIACCILARPSSCIMA